MNKYVALQICRHDAVSNAIYIDFLVRREWFEEYLNKIVQEDKNCDTMYTSVEKFLEEYTSEESEEVYSCAGLVNEIVRESVNK